MACIIYKLDHQDFYGKLDGYLATKDVTGAFHYMKEMLSKSEMAKDISGIISICNEMGGLYRATGNSEEAIRAHARVVNLMEEEDMADSEHYATALMNLADGYIAENNPFDALPLFLKAGEIFRDKGLSGDYRIAALYNNISHAYREVGSLEKAEEAINSALAIITEMPGHRDDLATTYGNLGELRIRQRNLEDAIEIFCKSRDIFLENEGRSVHYANTMAGLGQAYYLMGDYKAAGESYKRALELIERDQGKSPYYDIIAHNLEATEEKLSEERS